MTRLVEIVLTEEQAKLLAAAADVAIRADAEDQLITLEEGEAEALKQLATFMSAVALNPSAHPVSRVKQIKLRRALKRGSGPAQRPKYKSLRAKRRAETQGGQKRARKMRRAEVEAFNAKRARLEAELAEAAPAPEPAKTLEEAILRGVPVETSN